MQQDHVIAQSPLGKKSDYINTYSPELLFPIPRSKNGLFANAHVKLHGVDIWNAYEVSWLDKHGVPQVAMVEFRIPCDSPNIVESKSFKLYLNAFNQSQIVNWEQLQTILEQDLSKAAGATAQVTMFTLNAGAMPIMPTPGECIDQQRVPTVVYEPKVSLLQSDANQLCQEMLHSDLLKSNCPVTGQPDWATLVVAYQGPKIDRASLLSYIISYRQHGDFHEQCVEQIFADIWQQCRPSQLQVYARYVRRGGLDINPYRASYEIIPANHRTERQ